MSTYGSANQGENYQFFKAMVAAGLLNGAEGSSPRQNEYAGEILANGHRLLDLINDILDLTQMESGEQTAGRELIYLSDSVPALVARGQAGARTAGLPSNL